MDTSKQLSRRRWRDLSPPERGAVLAAMAAQVGLLAAALTDLRRRPQERVNGDKRLWTAVSFISFLGPLAYFAFGRKR